MDFDVKVQKIIELCQTQLNGIKKATEQNALPLSENKNKLFLNIRQFEAVSVFTINTF